MAKSKGGRVFKAGVILAFLVVVGGMVGNRFYLEHIASRAKDFCSAISVGENIDEVVRKGIEMEIDDLFVTNGAEPADANIINGYSRYTIPKEKSAIKVSDGGIMLQWKAKPAFMAWCEVFFKARAVTSTKSGAASLL